MSEKPKKSLYFIGLRVRGTERKEHCTCAFMGEQNDLTMAIYSLIEVQKMIDSRPIVAKVIGNDMFGKDNDVPVYKVEFTSNEMKEIFTGLWQKFDTKNFPEYSPHVTKKEGSRFDWKIGNEIYFDSVYIAESGQDGKIFSVYN